MPRYIVEVNHREVSFRRTWVRDAPSPEVIEAQLIEHGFDKRFWAFEIHAYSTNGEDF